MGQKLPENWEEKVTNFRQFVSRRKEELAIQADRVFNMKEQLTQLELKAFLYEPLVTRKETSLYFFTCIEMKCVGFVPNSAPILSARPMKMLET